MATWSKKTPPAAGESAPRRHSEARRLPTVDQPLPRRSACFHGRVGDEHRYGTQPRLGQTWNRVRPPCPDELGQEPDSLRSDPPVWLGRPEFCLRVGERRSLRGVAVVPPAAEAAQRRRPGDGQPQSASRSSCAPTLPTPLRSSRVLAAVLARLQSDRTWVGLAEAARPQARPAERARPQTHRQARPLPRHRPPLSQLVHACWLSVINSGDLWG